MYDPDQLVRVASYLEPDLVVCVPLAGDPVGDRVDDVNLEKVSRGGVCVIQGLLLAARKNNRLCKQCLRWKRCHEMILIQRDIAYKKDIFRTNKKLLLY